MVFRKDNKGGGWHEPPYTWEEERDFYRRINAGPMTIYRSAQPGAADKPAPQEQPPQTEKPRRTSKLRKGNRPRGVKGPPKKFAALRLLLLRLQRPVGGPRSYFIATNPRGTGLTYDEIT
jgi:hypothetical protein